MALRPEAPQMPLEPPDRKHWEANVGYVELGMFEDANDQLENIDPFMICPVVRPDEKLTAFVELESAVQSHGAALSLSGFVIKKLPPHTPDRCERRLFPPEQDYSTETGEPSFEKFSKLSAMISRTSGSPRGERNVK